MLVTTDRELREECGRAAGEFAQGLLASVVDAPSVERADEWMRKHGSALLRRMLGLALMLRAEKRRTQGRCACGQALEFRQHRPFTLHTVLPGRDVPVSLPYCTCRHCRTGSLPLVEELGADREGFSPALREMGLLAAVRDPFDQAENETLAKFAGVQVSHDKLHRLVEEHAAPAQQAMSTMPEVPPGDQPIYLGIDGGMAFVDKAWHEVKLAVLFAGEDYVRKDSPRADAGRGFITARHVVRVRGGPDELRARLTPLATQVAASGRRVVALGDGAPWIWSLVEELFPGCTQILDWFHVDEHIAAAARVLYGENTEEAARWRAVQLERLAHDGVDHVLEALEIQRKRLRKAATREAARSLRHYLVTNRGRLRYGTFKAQGLRIGSGFIESAVNHVMQQRMKRPGMRWKAAGADAMIALRCVYRTTGGWDRMLAHAKSRGTG